jgi:hypothetical protein
MGARSYDLGILLNYWLRASGFVKNVKYFQGKNFFSSLELLTNDSALLC